MPISETDKQILLGLIWALKPSDLSVLQACLQNPPGSQITTIKKSGNERFLSWLEQKGLARKIEQGLEIDEHAPTAISFILTEEGFGLLPAGIRLALNTGYPPKDSLITAECLDILHHYAEQGNGAAQNKLGALYNDGKGVTKSYEEALKWYSKAADNGDLKACNNIGVMHFAGTGVPKDINKALSWFSKAASLGSTGAMDNIGEIHGQGIGVPKNLNEAFKWFLKAAELGHSVAKCKVGDFYKGGLGVQQDFLQAYIWYSLGIASGVDVRERRDALTPQLTEEQISNANMLVSQWQPKTFQALG